ncbi:MAG: hypothetical protein RSB95_05090 [Bacilli bacterium]
MCELKQCPRCKNERLEGTENYCPICGLNLKSGMTNVDVISQIEDLIDEAEAHIKDDPFDSEVFRSDKEALETVKAAYERTAQEVPVQEQPQYLHKLQIIGEDIVKLDDFKLKGLTKYNLCKNSDVGKSKLDLTIIVDNSKMIF